jgi:hypothetical protein
MKQETLSILFFILKNKNKLLKNGEAPVILRVTIEGRGSDEVRIQRSISPNLWDQAKGRSIGKDRASLELNGYIRDLGVKLSSIHKELLLGIHYPYFTITKSLLHRGTKDGAFDLSRPQQRMSKIDWHRL